MKFRILLTVILIISISSSAQNLRYGITTRLGEYLSNDIFLFNEDSSKVQLKNYINKPTVLALVYYRCPGICSALLNGVAEVIDKSSLVPGIDYQIATISFVSDEKPSLAKAKKKNYLNLLKTKIDPKAWSFFTADSTTIHKLTNEVGFEFQKSGSIINHPALIFVISPRMKICRYLYGSYFIPMDLEMAVNDAKKEIADVARIKKIAYCHTNEQILSKSAKRFIIFSSVLLGSLFFGILFRLLLKGRSH